MFAPAPRSRAALIRGYTLVELLVALVIALFLLAGLLTIVQATRQTFNQQSALAQLQDNERLAMIMMGDVIQSAGYFPNPQAPTAFPAVAAVSPNPSFAVGQFVAGVSGGGAFSSDTISVRFAPPATLGTGNVNTDLAIINCIGGTDTQNGALTTVYTNTFSLDANGNLDCTLSVNGVAQPTVALVSGVKDLQIWYGVATPGQNGGNNVDTYYTATEVTSNGYWPDVSSVKVRLTFANPLACTTAVVVCPVTSLPNMTLSNGTTTVYLERVVGILGRTGINI
jgi:type IV pilus assembly protein PilW